MWVQLLFSILGIIILIITIIFLVVTRNQGKQINAKPNMPFVTIDPSRLRFTNGYGKGILKRALPRGNGTNFLEFFPIDVEQGKDVERPEVQSLIVAKDFFKPKPIGITSFRRQEISTLIRSALDLPEDMRNTLDGKFETIEGQKAFLVQAISPLISSGDESIAEINKDLNRGQLSKILIKQFEEEARSINKIGNIQESPKEEVKKTNT